MPQQREEFKMKHWATSTLEFRDFPSDIKWARPLNETKPKYWDYFHGNKWQFAVPVTQDKDEWVLVEASIFPAQDL